MSWPSSNLDFRRCVGALGVEMWPKIFKNHSREASKQVPEDAKRRRNLYENRHEENARKSIRQTNVFPDTIFLWFLDILGSQNVLQIYGFVDVVDPLISWKTLFFLSKTNDFRGLGLQRSPKYDPKMCSQKGPLRNL